MKRFVVLAGLLNLFGLSLFACSYADGTLFPTDYDYIKQTEAIVLAQPVTKIGYVVEFTVLEVLKGDFADKTFQAHELNTSCTVLSFSLELKGLPVSAQKKAKPKYLIFLSRSNDGWKMAYQASEAMNEIIVDADSSPFLKSIRHLVRTSAKNNYEAEKIELTRLKQLARGRRNPKEYPIELVRLVDDHFNAATPTKSYADLRKLYSRSSGDKARDALWALAHGKHSEAAAFFHFLLSLEIPPDYFGPISKYAELTNDEPLMVKLGRRYPGMDQGARWPVMWAMIKTADSRHSEMMLAALRSANEEESGRLAEWFVRYPANEAMERIRKLVGKNYREKWELTFPLAGMGDIAAIEWAKEFRNSDHKDRWMAFYTIARSPLEEADRLAKDVIAKANTNDLTSLVQGYEDSLNPNRWNRLRDIINLKDRDPEVDNWLRRTLAEMKYPDKEIVSESLKELER